MAASTSMTAPVRIVALGGLGEIGLNLMAIECAGRAIVIDCGVMFPDEPALGMGTYIPEMAWLQRSHVAIEAVGLTHAPPHPPSPPPPPPPPLTLPRSCT